MRLLIYFISILFLSSCIGDGVHRTSRYTDFPNNKNLHAQVVRLDTTLLRYPTRIAVRDSVAIVLDLHNSHHYFHAFAYPEWKYITSFGQKGGDTEEMLSAETFHFHSLDTIWTLDADRSEIIRWQISPSLSSVQQQERIQLDGKLVNTLDFCPMNSGFFVPDHQGVYRFHQINEKGECESSYERIPTHMPYKQAAAPILAQAWRSFIAYNSDKNILALATRLGEVIDIYYLDENRFTIKRGPGGDPEFRISQENSIPTGIIGFNDIQITDKYIYTIFHGRTLKDITADYVQGKKVEDGGRFIHVYDLDGQPACKYTLDRAIYGIYVDEEKGVILGTDVNGNEPIVQFSLM